MRLTRMPHIWIGSGSGSIDVEELFEYVDEKRTPITDALFAIMGT